MKMVLRIPWPPKGFLGCSGDLLPSHFLHMLVVDLVSLVDGSDSAFGGLGVGVGVAGMIWAQCSAEFHPQKGKTPQGEALMSLSRKRVGAENPCKGEEARWE